MKKKSTSQSAFFNLRVLIGAVFCLGALAVALFAQGNRTKQAQTSRSNARQDAPGTQTPDVVQMVGPVRTTTDVRHLPYIPNEGESEERRLTRYQFPNTGPLPSAPETRSPWLRSLLKNIFRPTPTMPGPLLTFDGMNSTETACGCLPPDTQGDVGPNHYVEALNVAYRVYDKSGNPLTPPITFNTLFQDLVGTPCSGSNSGDPFVLYDHVADRWLISDFAFASLSGPFYQCVAVSTSPDPAGTYNLYAFQHEPAHSDWIGDYPKFAMWSDPQPGGAYHFTVNLFDLSPTVTFNGVRVFALDRASMLAGGPANAIAFTIGLAGVGDSYSLVPAYFRTGDPPPAGRDEMLLAVDATIPGATLTEVHGWLFHVDFANPGNSTIGLGADHTPNAEITVNPFVQAWTAATYLLVPQDETVTSQKLDTLGDKIMTPVVYQNRNGTESLWADQTTMLNYPNGPTAVTWYQFDVTGGNFPATPVQQQEWTNGGDGLWRWMASIAVDADGNTAIGYSTSSPSIFAGIRYAGRLESDPPGNLAQGEAIMTNGGGAQTHSLGRWGDYTYLSIDPSNGMDFWHVNEYFTATSVASWSTKIGKFNFQGGGGTPTPTPTPAACSWGAGPDLPSAGTRFAGVYFPANGKFYAMGGRDVNNVEFTNPFEYDPGSNSWTTKSATYPDNHVNNIACGVLNDSGTDYIYCAGGSEFAGQTTSGQVFRYDPVADSITTVPSNWPPGDANILPGGFSVFNNKLYILGGFNVNTSVTDEIWEFTPNPAGWVQKSAVLPVPRAYIPTATIGNFIYTGGGADWDPVGQTLVDTTDSFRYDPVADSIDTIASIPRPTSNTRAVNFCNQMYVLGGAFNAPSNEVDIYDPVSDTWSVGIPFPTAGRNFAADTDGTNNIWKAGGYASDGATIIATMEIFNCPISPCGPTPTPTPTPTVTPTPTPRPPPTPRPRPTPHPRP